MELTTLRALIGLGRGVLLSVGYKTGLGEYLRAYTPGKLYVRVCDIAPDGRLRIDIKYDGLRRVKDILGLDGLQQLYIIIREEKDLFNPGWKQKVLYGWEKEEDLGYIAKACCCYLMATKAIHHDWSLLERPDPLGSFPRNVFQTNHALTDLAIAGKTGPGRKLVRWFKVENCGQNHRIWYRRRGQKTSVSGFNGYSHVVAVNVRQGSQLVAEFYEDESAALSASELLKRAVLAEKAGRKRPWQPLDSARITYTQATTGSQAGRIAARELSYFLLADGLAVGESLDLQPYFVTPKGAIRINFSTGEGDQLFIAHGYSGFAGDKLPGRVVVANSGTEKKVYFWADCEARTAGLPPIIPEGHLFAQRNGRNIWELCGPRESPGLRLAQQRTKHFGNSLFATLNGQIRTHEWKVYSRTIDRCKLLRMDIRGQRLELTVTDVPGLGEVAYSQVGEFGQKFKVITFFIDPKMTRPFASRFIVFKPDDGPWQLFWKSFQEARRKKEITKGELEAIFRNPRMSHLPERFLIRCIDELHLV